jgi:hypothetical protein
MKTRVQTFCSFVDDVPAEASAIIDQLRQRGFPVDLHPVFPAPTTIATYTQITKARPAAAIIDFRLLARPRVEVERLGAKLISHRIPTVFVTKDRNVVDEGPRDVGGIHIPVFHKQKLITEHIYLRDCIKQLGLQPTPQRSPLVYKERLAQLEEKDLLRKLKANERNELEALRALAKLDETAEAERIQTAHKPIKDEVDSLVHLIREVTRELKRK